MNTLRAITCAFLFAACTLVAADRVTVQRVDLFGPNGAVHGHLIMTDNQLVFVDDTNPDSSFILPKSDIQRARMEGGRLTITSSRPIDSSFGRESNMILVLPDESSTGRVITWMGVPVAGYSGSADRVVVQQESAPLSATNPNVNEVSFDVRNGDQQGQLIFHQDSVAFESLSDASHSRRWAYSEIKELHKHGKEIKIEPYHGDKYEFQFNDPAMRDTVYNMLSDRIVNARQGVRR